MKTIGPFIIKILVNALNIAETPTPIIINFFVDVDFPQIKKIITTAKKENIKVNIGIYNIDVVKEKFGVLIERDRRRRMGCTIFEMTSHYYLCSVIEERGEQHLDKYEEELGFTPIWISLDEVIRENENILNQREKINPWVKRETFVLKKIKEYLNEN